MRSAHTLAVVILGAALTGCASTPEALRGGYNGPAPAEAGEEDIGAAVRWGGRLLEVQPQRDRTCFEILARELDDIARPVESSTRPGRRFLACRDGFADPASYPADSDITVVGEISGFETRPIGEYDYRYPVLSLEAAHVWPERRTVDPSPLPPPRWWYDPYWYYYP
jgi:outer membrane lipoprotein